MTPHDLQQLLDAIAAGRVTAAEGVARLRTLPFEAIEGAAVDHHRALRTGQTEVVFCQGKTPAQVAAIMQRLAEHHPQVLGTRAEPEQFDAVRSTMPDARWHASARCITLDRQPDRPRRDGIVIVCAGTSDLPVADEAAVTLDMLGHRAHRVTDVGVAGLHRLLPHVPALRAAACIICVAGMEGALPSVVAGLVPCPVIAVPTSVGYGASFGGLAALLGMLNSCAAGISVVNIDNGYGAAALAARIHAVGHDPSAS